MGTPAWASQLVARACPAGIDTALVRLAQAPFLPQGPSPPPFTSMVVEASHSQGMSWHHGLWDLCWGRWNSGVPVPVAPFLQMGPLVGVCCPMAFPQLVCHTFGSGRCACVMEPISMLPDSSVLYL